MGLHIFQIHSAISDLLIMVILMRCKVSAKRRKEHKNCILRCEAVLYTIVLFVWDFFVALTNTIPANARDTYGSVVKFRSSTYFQNINNCLHKNVQVRSTATPNLEILFYVQKLNKKSNNTFRFFSEFTWFFCSFIRYTLNNVFFLSIQKRLLRK